MSDYGGAPTVRNNVAETYELDVDHKYVHLDDVDELSSSEIERNRLTIYTFEDEDRHVELRKQIDGLRGDYILATGIVWPSWVANEIDEIDDELLTTLQWLLVINEDVTENDLAYVRDVHGAMNQPAGANTEDES